MFLRVLDKLVQQRRQPSPILLAPHRGTHSLDPPAQSGVLAVQLGNLRRTGG
jgi:hypothetical protein